MIVVDKVVRTVGSQFFSVSIHLPTFRKVVHVSFSNHFYLVSLISQPLPLLFTPSSFLVFSPPYSDSQPSFFHGKHLPVIRLLLCTTPERPKTQALLDIPRFSPSSLGDSLRTRHQVHTLVLTISPSSLFTNLVYILNH